jgi:hypothetical protein
MNLVTVLQSFVLLFPSLSHAFPHAPFHKSFRGLTKSDPTEHCTDFSGLWKATVNTENSEHAESLDIKQSGCTIFEINNELYLINGSHSRSIDFPFVENNDTKLFAINLRVMTQWNSNKSIISMESMLVLGSTSSIKGGAKRTNTNLAIKDGYLEVREVVGTQTSMIRYAKQ